jgi:hypothetical protein
MYDVKTPKTSHALMRSGTKPRPLGFDEFQAVSTVSQSIQKTSVNPEI